MSKIYISPSGLTVISQSTEEELAISNFSFSSGVHFWEIYCPISCNNIQIGLIKAGFDVEKLSESKAEFVNFRTTTPRLVGMRLDLEE
jgi:hypothetical protein